MAEDSLCELDDVLSPNVNSRRYNVNNIHNHIHKHNAGSEDVDGLDVTQLRRELTRARTLGLS